MSNLQRKQVNLKSVLNTSYKASFAMNSVYRTIDPSEFMGKKYYFAVGAVFRNEAHILKEWIDHYLHHGAEQIYLINDQSTDNYNQVLEPYLKPKTTTDPRTGERKHNPPKVKLFHFHPTQKHFKGQKEAYRRYLTRACQESRWLAIVDLDEFIYAPSYVDIKDVLHMYEDVPGIGVNWLCFGSNDYIEQPKSVVHSFTRRAQANDLDDNAHIKSIVQTPYLRDFGIHEHKLYNNVKVVNTNRQEIEKCFNIPILDDVLVCNHYIIQSLNWYRKKKMGQKHSFHFKNKYTMEYFHNHDINELEDLRLSRQNKTQNATW